MQLCIRSLPLLFAGLGLLPGHRVVAQSFTNLHSFSGAGDGANPYASLILSGNTLYGTASAGGSSGKGTVFKVNINGTGFTNLHNFTATSGSFFTNSEGAVPYAALIFSSNTLYGTAAYGGSSGNGSVFKLNIDGTGFTNLHNFTAASSSLFTNSDGASPFAGLVLSGSTLYGTANGGGTSGNGTVFRINSDGTAFTNLHNFTGGSDEGNVDATLILSGNTLYGTTEGVFSSGYGTVFKINTDGTSFTNLHSFTGSDGAEPEAGVVLSGGTLYGTVEGGGTFGQGTVFAVNADGTGFTNLHNFTGNSDGGLPEAGLILSGNTLYGTTQVGGAANAGTVFAVNTDGTGFTNLWSFAGGSGGVAPYAGLILSGNTLYGTTTQGGSAGKGMVFSLSLPPPPQLTITRFGTNVVLAWPTNNSGFTLQSTTNLASLVTWTDFTNAPATVGAEFTITNSISDSSSYYRLRR
jgi:uncharacterized repeat protein (TIGR03803 family)